MIGILSQTQKMRTCQRAVFMLLWIYQGNLHKIKKEEHLILAVNVASMKVYDTLVMKECHFFIIATNKDRRNKMIAMYRRILIIKILFFIFINPPFL